MKKIISLISAVLFVVMLGSCDKVEEPTPNPEDLIIEKKVVVRGEPTLEEPTEEVLLEATEENCDFTIEANGKTYYMVESEDKKIFDSSLLPQSKTFNENAEKDFVYIMLKSIQNYEKIDLNENYVINFFRLTNAEDKQFGLYKITKTTENNYEVSVLYREIKWHFDLEEGIYCPHYVYVIDSEEYKELTITLEKLPSSLKNLIEDLS